MSKHSDIASLHGKFRGLEIYLSDNIRSSLLVRLGRLTIEGASTQAEVSLEENAGTLKLFLPINEDSCEICIESSLPRSFCKYLNIVEDAANRTLSCIFRRERTNVINGILENEGVSNVEFDFDVTDDSLAESRDENVSDADEGSPAVDGQSRVSNVASVESELSKLGSDDETIVDGTDDIVHTSYGGQSLEADRQPRLAEGQSYVKRSHFMPRSDLSEPVAPPQFGEVQEIAYKRVLENVVQAAQERAQTERFQPTRTVSRQSSSCRALSRDVVQQAFEGRSLERDFRLGAAGELFMYEFLKKYGLPDFGIANWKSEIRGRVAAHSDYRDLRGCYDANAKADIEFHDTAGKFTSLLLENGLLSVFGKPDKPYYHIEVKSTTSKVWQEPFF